jgi:hypothetical protein
LGLLVLVESMLAYYNVRLCDGKPVLVLHLYSPTAACRPGGCGLDEAKADLGSLVAVPLCKMSCKSHRQGGRCVSFQLGSGDSGSVFLWAGLY